MRWRKILYWNMRRMPFITIAYHCNVFEDFQINVTFQQTNTPAQSGVPWRWTLRWAFRTISFIHAFIIHLVVFCLLFRTSSMCVFSWQFWLCSVCFGLFAYSTHTHFSFPFWCCYGHFGRFLSFSSIHFGCVLILHLVVLCVVSACFLPIFYSLNHSFCSKRLFG